MPDYDDIINLPHHVSTKRPQMSMLDRAAQFSPFAALTGYDAAIKETGRLTDEKIEMDEESLNMLNMKFQLLVDALDENQEVSFTYFKPDETKAGGAYVTALTALALLLGLTVGGFASLAQTVASRLGFGQAVTVPIDRCSHSATPPIPTARSAAIAASTTPATIGTCRQVDDSGAMAPAFSACSI